VARAMSSTRGPRCTQCRAVTRLGAHVGKVIVTELAALDGVGQASGKPEEDHGGWFEPGGWQAPVADRKSGEVTCEQAKNRDDFLLGRKTDEILADSGQALPSDLPHAPLCRTQIGTHDATRQEHYDRQ
jgi:hypothetical protein